MWTCKNCETNNNDGDNYCIICGLKRADAVPKRPAPRPAPKPKPDIQQSSLSRAKPAPKPAPEKVKKPIRKRWIVLPIVAALCIGFLIVVLNNLPPSGTHGSNVTISTRTTKPQTATPTPKPTDSFVKSAVVDGISLVNINFIQRTGEYDLSSKVINGETLRWSDYQNGEQIYACVTIARNRPESTAHTLEIYRDNQLIYRSGFFISYEFIDSKQVDDYSVSFTPEAGLYSVYVDGQYLGSRDLKVQEAPSGYSGFFDKYFGTFTYNGTSYSLPMKVSSFLERGWSVGNPDDLNVMLEPGNPYGATLYRYGSGSTHFYASIFNNSKERRAAKDCVIVCIEISSEDLYSGDTFSWRGIGLGEPFTSSNFTSTYFNSFTTDYGTSYQCVYNAWNADVGFSTEYGTVTSFYLQNGNKGY